MNQTRWDDGMAEGSIYEGNHRCCSCLACAIISVAITFFSRIDTGFVEERSGYMTPVFPNVADQLPQIYPNAPIKNKFGSSMVCIRD